MAKIWYHQSFRLRDASQMIGPCYGGGLREWHSNGID